MQINYTGDIFCQQKYGGVSRYFVELALSLIKIDGSIQPRFCSPLYVNRYLYEHRHQLRHRGLYLPFVLRGASLISRLLTSFSDLEKSQQSDSVIHETYYGHHSLQRAKGRKTATFYDMIHERFSNDRSITHAKKKTFDLCQKVIAISEATKCDMVDFMKVQPERITVVHLSANISSPTETPRIDRLVKYSSSPYMLWVGPRGWYKNFDGFARAFGNSQAPTLGFRIICAGGNPPSVEEKEHWKELGLNPNIVTHISPTDGELAWLYRNAECLIYTSLFEGFGIPPLEAMSYGCPVVASNAGSIPEVVGDSSVLVEPSETDSITAGINCLLSSKAYRSELISKGLRRAAMFSGRQCAEKTLAFYKAL